MKFNRKSFIAIAGADGKPFDKLKLKPIFGWLLLGIVIVLCLRSRALRTLAFIAVSIVLAGIFGGAIGTIFGWSIVFILGSVVALGRWLQRLGAKFTSSWQSKPTDSEDFERQPLSTFSRLRSVRSQLRNAASQSRSERLRLIAELQALIRSRSPNLSIQDLQDLNFLGREHHQIIDEESWSPMRRSRVDRIAQIRTSRRTNGQNLPTGLVEDEEESEFIVTYSDLQRYGGLDDDEPDGIGDLTCEYNAHSLFLRCAVNPGVDSCEGCRDYRSRDLAAD
jgi:Family of unknown function (DUF6464)